MSQVKPVTNAVAGEIAKVINAATSPSSPSRAIGIFSVMYRTCSARHRLDHRRVDHRGRECVHRHAGPAYSLPWDLTIPISPALVAE